MKLYYFLWIVLITSFFEFTHLGKVWSAPEIAIINAKTYNITIPSSIDLSQHLPPVKDQGSLNSCTAWAVAYYYKSFQERRERNWIYDDSLVFSPSYIYNQIPNNSNGALLSTALQVVVDQGVAPYSQFPYNENDNYTQPSDTVKAIARKYRAKSFQPLYGYTGGTPFGTIDDLRRHLASGDPFVIGIPIYFRARDIPGAIVGGIVNWQNWFKRLVSTTIDVPSNTVDTVKLDIGHAVTVVGYDDTKRRFKFVNSWGTDWGESGYGYLTYDFVIELEPGYAAFAMVDSVVEPSTPEPSYNESLFLKDSSLPDNSIVVPGQVIDKIWQVKNTGSTTWGAGYTLEFRGGQNFSAGVASVPALAPGQTGEIRLPLRIPTGLASGTYQGDWKLRSPTGQYFGDPLWYKLNIGGAGGTTTPTTIRLQVKPGEVIAPQVTVAAPTGGMYESRGDMLRHEGTIESRYGTWQHVPVRGTLNSGATYTFTMNDPPMQAPGTNGTYRSTWRLWVGGQYVGPTYTIELVVGSGSGNSLPPNTPILTEPGDWYVAVAQQPRLCAQAQGDPDGDAVEEYYFETFESAHLWASGWVREPCVTTNGLPPAGYQWHAKVRDSNGTESSWSERRRFNIESDRLTITDFQFEPASPSASDVVVVRAATAGCAGLIGGMRVFVNTAADGSTNGQWVPIVGELGVPRYNDTDAPRWDTLEWETGTHLVRLQARGCDRDGTVVNQDLPYTLLPRRPSRPYPIAPTHDFWTNQRQVTFQWNPALRATDYRLVVGTTEDPLASVIAEQVTMATSATLTFDQPYPTLYWAVYARNQYGETTPGPRLMGIDEATPESSIDQVRTDDLSFEPKVPVFWESADNPPEVRHAGVRDHTVQVKRPFEQDWRDWLVAYADFGAIYRGGQIDFETVDGNVYCFRTSASDRAGNTEVFAAAADSCVTVDPTQRPPQPWFNTVYGAKRNLIIQNPQAAGIPIPAGYPVRLLFDTTTEPTAAQLLQASQANGNDFQVVYNNATEIPRIVTAFRTDRVEIWFPLQASLADSDQVSYALYYGNAAATDPGYTPSDVFLPQLDAQTRIWLSFDTQQATTFIDESGHNNHGHIVGAAAQGDSRYGKGLLLQGGYVRVNTSPTIENIDRTITMEAWVKPSVLTHHSRDILVRQGIGERASWMLFTRQNGEVVFQPHDTDGPWGVDTRGSVLQVGVWTHIAAVVDATHVRLFINGVESNRRTLRGLLFAPSRAWLGIGNTLPNNTPFEGLIDQVHVSAAPKTSFPYAFVKSDPLAEAGEEQLRVDGPPIPGVDGNGWPDLTITNVTAIPDGDQTIIVQTTVTNQGDGVSWNQPTLSLYQEHVPSGPGDYAQSIAHIDHDFLRPGQTATMTIQLERSAFGELDATEETTFTLAAQIDSVGTTPEQDKTNNIWLGSTLCVAAKDAHEGNDTAAEAPVLPLGQAQRHNADHPGDEDWVRFTAVAGQEYRLRTSTLGVTADTIITLYESDGTTLLGTSDDTGGSLASDLSWIAPRSDTFYARVTQWSPAAGGCGTTYDLTLTSTTILSIPDGMGRPGSRIYLPVNLREAQGVRAIEGNIVFDPAILKPISVIRGSLTHDWLFAFNQLSGRLRLAMSGTAVASTDDDSIAFIEFQVVGPLGGSTAISFEQVLLNDGAIVPQLEAGRFVVDQTVNLQGNVRHWNGKAVEATRLVLHGDSGVVARSTTQGQFTLQAKVGGNYTLTAVKAADTTGITAYDAVLVLRSLVGLQTLGTFAAQAADVNQNRGVTAMDAALILDVASGKLSLPFPGASSPWLFAPSFYRYEGLPSGQTNQDFTAILLGDVSGNWGISNAGTFATTQADETNAEARIVIQTNQPDADGWVTSVVLMEAPTTTTLGLDLRLRYDPALLSGMRVQTANEESEAITSINTTTPGQISIAFAQIEVTTNTTTIAVLQYRPATSAAHPIIVDGLLNEGQIPLVWEGKNTNPIRLYLPVIFQ